MENYKKTKVIFKCNEKDKELFKNSSCSVTVSIGHKSQEGIRFAATIHNITSHFKECTIMVCDSLHRHDLLMHNPKDHKIVHKKANEIGDDWLKANEKYFSLFTIPYHVIRWDYWVFHEKYIEAAEKIEQLFKKNEEYRESFFNTIDAFMERFGKNVAAEYFNSELVVKHSLDYLKEECAVMLLWAKNKYNFEIYPSKRNEAMAATYKHFIAPEYSNVLKPVALDIRVK